MASNFLNSGGAHVDYRINLGGEKLVDCSNLLSGNYFQYSTQCRNIKAFVSINKTLTEARQSESILKFLGNLNQQPEWTKSFYSYCDSED